MLSVPSLDAGESWLLSPDEAERPPLWTKAPMLLTFLDKLSGFFERSFVVACWMPVFIAAGLFGGVLGTVLG